MNSKGGNRTTTWTRGLVAGLGAVAMAAAITWRVRKRPRRKTASA